MNLRNKLFSIGIKACAAALFIGVVSCSTTSRLGKDDVLYTGIKKIEYVPKDAQKKIPAEVKAFLDAVAAIPEITPDNAEEMSEYLYGEVAQFFEDLLGTEYEDRKDVQAAAAAMSEAMKAVDAALEME